MKNKEIICPHCGKKVMKTGYTCPYCHQLIAPSSLVAIRGIFTAIGIFIVIAIFFIISHFQRI